MAAFINNLQTCVQNNTLCKAFGLKISNSAQTVLLARNAGYDALWIDLEHGWLTLGEASNLCLTSMLAGITPFVRVPHQCGNGFVQRVLDGGAMGVIFPHIHSAGPIASSKEGGSDSRLISSGMLQTTREPLCASRNTHRSAAGR